MRLPNTAHTSRPWRIHELTPDFQVLDVWALPTPGGPDDFPRLVDLLTTFDPARSTSPPVRFLFAVRWMLGDLLGLDAPETGLDDRVPSLRDRMPTDLLDAAVPAIDALPFKPLYQLDDEYAAEIANRTVHGVLHAGWVADGHGGYRGQLAVLVKPNGLLGRLYLEFIRPFRHVLVYPAMLDEISREWQPQASASPAGAGGP